MYSDSSRKARRAQDTSAARFSGWAALCDLTGVWSGNAQVFNRSVHFIFHVTSDENDIHTVFDCPEAGLKDQPVLETRLSRNIVRFEMDDFETTCCGLMNPQLGEITANIYYAGYGFPLKLTR